MAVDGIYSVTFRGAADWGMGLLMFHRGVITGADASGVTFDGTYRDSDDSSAISAQVKMTVPPGTMLVQGFTSGSEAEEIPFSVRIPKNSMERQDPVRIELPPGPVNAIFRKLRDL